MLHSEAGICAAFGLALLMGAVGGWLFRSRWGGPQPTARSSSRRGSAADLEACAAAGRPAPRIVDGATEMQNPVAGGGAPSVRNTFSIALDRCLPEAARRGDPLSVVLVRLDDSRCGNDCYGTPGHDKLIEEAGKLFVASVRSTDWVARLDARTFAFLLLGTGHSNALIVAERLRKAVSNAELPSGAAPIRLTLSMGTTEFRAGDSSASLLRRAEEAMLSAVQAGGDCVRSRVGGPGEPSSSGNCAVAC